VALVEILVTFGSVRPKGWQTVGFYEVVARGALAELQTEDDQVTLVDRC
jgi:hypothetical protein